VGAAVACLQLFMAWSCAYGSDIAMVRVATSSQVYSQTNCSLCLTQGQLLCSVDDDCLCMHCGELYALFMLRFKISWLLWLVVASS
jgi:hypothetical protein